MTNYVSSGTLSSAHSLKYIASLQAIFTTQIKPEIVPIFGVERCRLGLHIRQS